MYQLESVYSSICLVNTKSKRKQEKKLLNEWPFVMKFMMNGNETQTEILRGEFGLEL